MARQFQPKQLLSFVGGLNTESSPLTFAENTAKALDNVDLQRSGSIRRRRGLNFETGAAYNEATWTDAELDSLAISVHKWSSIDGDDSLNFLVVQIGGILYFHNAGQEALSSAVLGSIDLAPIKNHETLYEETAIDAASAKGKLFIVSRYLAPAYIQYNVDTNDFTGVKVTIKIRDTDGIVEEDESPIVFGEDVTPVDPEDPLDDFDDIPDFDFEDQFDPDDLFPWNPNINIQPEIL